ncbi:hypothetical protein BJY17_003000 [Agromyces hippuratus]|uniref:Lipoprotein n=1 Tax=Agromyces hippuratus TaxID=286438 RepID=A0A852X276_9MICO|nr:hypothetical protein [Agromyces hippuratus]NYG22253.1 hypothetical protein [Agromyces hippuratus]
MTSTRLIAAGSLAALALLFTGCAAGTAADTTKGEASAEASKPEPKAEAGQTKDEACEIVKSSMEELTGLTTVDMSDAAAALAAFETVKTSLTEASGQISNEEVSVVATGAADAVTAYSELISAITTDPASVDMTKISEQAATLQTSMTDLVGVCSTIG